MQFQYHDKQYLAKQTCPRPKQSQGQDGARPIPRPALGSLAQLKKITNFISLSLACTFLQNLSHGNANSTKIDILPVINWYDSHNACLKAGSRPDRDDPHLYLKCCPSLLHHRLFFLKRYNDQRPATFMRGFDFGLCNENFRYH
ncbi:hypothetical protein K443DRAFT_325975 [Laccaria amethystina LaAM-08-1]|uniref:Uncharacterized protein n=1 Tax=Laccaria amethystina LaAM-08-1 TaxID=1095629 RepID=A0A0C9Y6A0_9AGAR|nr:hypothetical protein K443DRAFT_325975 [Laccaria amethystina LaAM-08-1]